MYSNEKLRYIIYLYSFHFNIVSILYTQHTQVNLEVCSQTNGYEYRAWGGRINYKLVTHTYCQFTLISKAISVTYVRYGHWYACKVLFRENTSKYFYKCLPTKFKLRIKEKGRRQYTKNKEKRREYLYKCTLLSVSFLPWTVRVYWCMYLTCCHCCCCCCCRLFSSRFIVLVLQAYRGN